MVKWLFPILLLASQPGLAIHKASVRALNMLTDDLQEKLKSDPSFPNKVQPMLLARPTHFWKKSRSDFGAYSTSKMMKIFDKQVIVCEECDTWRLESSLGRSTIRNGSLGLSEIQDLRESYGNMNLKSYASIKETREGVEMRIIDINDGSLLYYSFMNIRDVNLNDQQPWNRFAQEKSRRISGDSLHYSFLNIGLYTAPIFELEFVEQWGAKNQHISGLSLLLFTPNLGPSLGLTYHYVLPSMPRIQVSGSAYYSLQSAIIDTDTGSTDFALRGMAQMRISNTYAVFGALDSTGNFSLGFTLYNPILLPFLL